MRDETTKLQPNTVQQDQVEPLLDLPNSALVRNKAIVSNNQVECPFHRKQQITGQRDNKNSNSAKVTASYYSDHSNTAHEAQLKCNDMASSNNKLPDICSSALKTTTDQKSSLIEELMSLEERRGGYMCSGFQNEYITDIERATEMPQLIQENRCHQANAAQFWRQYAELSQALRGQHKFLMAKLEERKRDLLLVEAVWRQRDLRHAIERLLELYSQGLVFGSTQASESFRNRSGVRLGSLKSALVSDIIGILLLRPKLWSLDLCQLLLPVVVGDLLQQRVPGSEGHVEVALRAIRLTLVQLGPLITNTLESQKESARLSGGVDLSREERINKCLACYKLLAEARRQLLQTRLPGGINGARLVALKREIEPLFRALGVDSRVKLYCPPTSQERRARAN